MGHFVHKRGKLSEMGMRANPVGSVPAFAAACIGALFLTGCVGGTTYGTGVSQEKQTLKDVYSMFSLSTERKNIDYAPRPDLIVPENKKVLVEPLEQEATASNTEWPETPEQRIARIRAQAGEVDPRTGDVSIQEQLRKKDGIGIETQNGVRKFIPGQTDRDGDLLAHVNPNDVARQDVMKRKAELGTAPTGTRRYLTDPPVAYREPAATAPIGDEAYTEEELAARKAEAKRIADEKNKLMKEK